MSNHDVTAKTVNGNIETITNSETNTPQQATLDLSIALMERPSVTPDDTGCQDILSTRLEQAGFDCEFMYFGDRQKAGTC